MYSTSKHLQMKNMSNVEAERVIPEECLGQRNADRHICTTFAVNISLRNVHNAHDRKVQHPFSVGFGETDDGGYI